MNESAWNNVIWLAIQNLRNLYSNESKHTCIDDIFFACEKELCTLNAPEREIELRLFALALYCDKTYGSYFFKSVFFLRYALALDFSHFERTARILIEENSLAVVVFWTVFRLSFGNYVPRNSYIPLEKEMRNKSLELGLKIQPFCK